jgi:lysophospholipase L1-like esterase
MMMKPVLALLLAAGIISSPAREMNLAPKLTQWKHSGPGGIKVEGHTVVRLSGGQLEHWVDLDYVEHSSPENTVTADRFYRMTVMARGAGEIRLGVVAYPMTGKFSFEQETRWSEPFRLSGEWQECRFERQETNPATIFHNKLMIQYTGSGEAELKNVSFVYPDRNDFSIRFSPSMATAVPGDIIRLKIETGRPAQPLAIRIYDGHTRIAHGFTEEMRTTDKDGIILLETKVPAQCRDGLRITASDPETGVKNSFFITLVPPVLQKELQERRARIANLPFRHILFLGDSISDYDRGRNYIDMVSANLPPGVTVRNAGVGGDFAARLWQRLQGDNAHRQEMYERLFEPKPDLVFLLLGGNDTKASSANQYEVPVTPPEEQVELYRKIIRHLREKTGAKIVFLNAKSSYWPEQAELAAKKMAAGIAHNRFGEDRHIVRFNQTLEQIAKEENIDIIDLYTPTKNHSDKRSLYLPDDGTHLTIAGHSLLAQEVLKYLAGLGTSVSAR